MGLDENSKLFLGFQVSLESSLFDYLSFITFFIDTFNNN